MIIIINLLLILFTKAIARTTQFLVSVSFGAILGFLAWQHLTEPSDYHLNLLKEWTWIIIIIVLVINFAMEVLLYWVNRKLEEIRKSK